MAKAANAISRDFVAEAVAILRAATRPFDLAGREEIHILGIEQFVVLQCVGKCEKVLDRRVTSTGGSSAIRKRIQVREPLSLVVHFRVTDRSARNRLIFWQRVSGVHSCGLEYVLANIVVVVLATGLLDDQAQQQKPIVAVFPAAAGLEGQTPLAVKLDVILERAQLQAVLVELGAEEVAGASSVSQKVVNGDFGGHVFVGIVGEILAERIGEIEFAGLHQLQNRRRREHFVHGANAKLRARMVGNFLIAVGHSINGSEYLLPVLRNQGRSGKMTGGGSLVQVGTKGLERLRFRRAGDGKVSGARNGAKFDLFDNVRLGRIHLDHDSGKLVGIAFLQHCRTFRDVAIASFLKIEAAGLFAKTDFVVNFSDASGKVFLQEGEKHGPVAATESDKPCGKLMRCRGVWKLYLRRQADGSEQNQSGQP